MRRPCPTCAGTGTYRYSDGISWACDACAGAGLVPKIRVMRPLPSRRWFELRCYSGHLAGRASIARRAVARGRR